MNYATIKKALDSGKIKGIELGASDYSGDLTDVANIKWIKDNLKAGRDYVENPNNIYGYDGLILIRNKHTKDIIDGLESYPLIDDEVYSKIEWELKETLASELIDQYNLKDNPAVFSAMIDAVNELTYPRYNGLDYSESKVIDRFKELYKESRGV